MQTTVTLADIVRLQPELNEWHWQYGRQRAGVYALPRSAWLDEIQRIGAEAKNIAKSQADTAKAAMGIWGPSQSGKSTLLASCIDGQCDEYGNGSALHWSESKPVRFVGDLQGGKVTVLNPYNKGADASGCVTRFVMSDRVPNANFPVHLIFASEQQIMHALAVGYLSETKATDENDQVVKLNPDLLTKLLSDSKATGPAKRDAFDNLVQIVNTLEMLVYSNLDRYENLKGHWRKSLRSEILDCESLVCGIEPARAFSESIFWDSWPSISKRFRELSNNRKMLHDKFGDLPLYLSFPLAAQLLNISAVELAEQLPVIKSLIDSIGYEITDGRVNIGEGLAHKLFANLDEFALFQGLVWELVVPLRADVIRANSPAAAELLEVADLLDFPGVANEFKGPDLLTDDKLTADGKLILTQVLKRGKTASIAVTSSRDLNIDGFSLLMRMNRYPSHPVQLNSGIWSWWESFGNSWPPKGKDLPLNLVLTFSAVLLNDVAHSGVGHGLEQVFDKMKKLAYLSDPSIVNTYATNYPQFPDGVLQVDAAKLDSIVSQILNDRAFQRQFGDTAESFKEMALNGGRDYFLKALTMQARNSRRQHLLQAKADKRTKEFAALLREALPGEQDASALRERDLDQVITMIKARLEQGHAETTCADVGLIVQGIVNVDPDELDQLPMRASKGANATQLRVFLDKQLVDWREKKSKKVVDGTLALDAPDSMTRLLTYLVEDVDLQQLHTWFKSNLGNIKGRTEASESRRFLAAMINNMLLSLGNGSEKQKHRETDKTDALLRSLAESEFTGNGGIEESTYFIGIIKPFLQKIEYLKTSARGERGIQPGDSQLLDLLKI